MRVAAAGYLPIEAAQAYAAGRADSIAGLEAPDAKTLVVLTQPTGDLGGRMALPAAAPIPPGIAEGREDYGPYLVASGPYMLEGWSGSTPRVRGRSKDPRRATVAAR
jgi:ABC-type oligopeptide transport system substrate-binding subunit